MSKRSRKQPVNQVEPFPIPLTSHYRGIAEAFAGPGDLVSNGQRRVTLTLLAEIDRLKALLVAHGVEDVDAVRAEQKEVQNRVQAEVAVAQRELDAAQEKLDRATRVEADLVKAETLARLALEQELAESELERESAETWLVEAELAVAEVAAAREVTDPQVVLDRVKVWAEDSFLPATSDRDWYGVAQQDVLDLIESELGAESVVQFAPVKAGAQVTLERVKAWAEDDSLVVPAERDLYEVAQQDVLDLIEKTEESDENA